MKHRAYIDIETTGLSRYDCELTVIGIAHEKSRKIEVIQLIEDDLCQESLLEALEGENEAKYVAAEDIASAAEGWLCLKAKIKKPSTIGTGGAVTRGDTGGTTGDLLFLSTTQGKAVEVPDGDGILQVVGQVLSQDEVLLDPAMYPVSYLMELEAANKTAVERMMSARPILTGIATARDVIPGMHDKMLLHAGPPIEWERMSGPLRGAVIGALIFEGLAKDEA